MPDLTSISAILGSIKTAADIAKLIKDSGTSLEEAEIKLKIAELIGALADAKIEVAGIQTEILKKDEVIKELNDKLNLKESVIWEKPYYWTGEGDKRDGPFCQRCYDDNQKLMRLQGGGTNFWRCSVCSSSYADNNYRRPTQPRRIVRR